MYGKKKILVLGQDFTLRPNPNFLVDFRQISYLHLIFFLCKMTLDMAVLKFDVHDNKN